MQASLSRLHFQLDTAVENKPPPESHVVNYCVFPGSQIIFSGARHLDGTMHYSTVNHAELIIYSILKKENLRISGCTFFDLKTHENSASVRFGQYSLCRLNLKVEGEKITRVDWKDVHGTRDALRYFAGFINGGNPDARMINVSVRQGSLRPVEECCVPSTAYQNVIDLLILTEDKQIKDSSLHIEYQEWICRLMRALGNQLVISEYTADILANIPRDTVLGPEADVVYHDFCEWLLASKVCSDDDLTECIFLE